jgi:hypothetical protein
MGGRFDDVPELQDRVADLSALGIDDVLVRPVDPNDEDRAGWVAVICFTQPAVQKRSHREDAYRRPAIQTFRWRLGDRPTKGEASQAATALLQGLLDGQTRARFEHPSLPDEQCDHEASDEAAYRAFQVEWRVALEHRPPEPAGWGQVDAVRRAAEHERLVHMARNGNQWAKWQLGRGW